MRTRGVLLAGGRGERLGLGVPKPLAVVGGATLLERAAGTLARVSDEILVAAPAGAPRAAPTVLVPVRHVADREPGGGPLAGIVAAFDDGGFDRAFVLGVDFPLATAATLSALLERLARSGALAVVPAPGGRLQPLFAAYAAAAARPLRDTFDAGERSAVRAVERLGPEVLDADALAELPGGLEGLLNLNTREDLAAAEARLARAAHRS